MSTLPAIMVAPNGARRGPRDHPAIPLTIARTVADAAACYEAGANGLHAHVRDVEGRHSLDAGAYRELLGEMARRVPGMIVQITTESVGRYSPADQMALIRELVPTLASVALRELMQDETEVGHFYHWALEAGIGIQHILYTAEDVGWLADLVRRGAVPEETLETIFVLGRYGDDRESIPADLAPFLDAARGLPASAQWAACAFGRNETTCLLAALRRGGKARVGFENNLMNADGSRARDNAERVRELVAAWQAAPLVDPQELIGRSV